MKLAWIVYIGLDKKCVLYQEIPLGHDMVEERFPLTTYVRKLSDIFGSRLVLDNPMSASLFLL